MARVILVHHGAKHSREAVIAGLTNWRMHLLVLTYTFVLFPLLGVLTQSPATPLELPNVAFQATIVAL